MIKIENSRVYSTVEGAKVRRLSDGLTGTMISAMPGQTAADFEEVSVEEAVRIAAMKAAEEKERRRQELYAQTVSRLVQERYPMDAEMALASNLRDPEQLANAERAAQLAEEEKQYQAYRAECKARAAAMVEAQLTAEASDNV